MRQNRIRHGQSWITHGHIIASGLVNLLLFEAGLLWAPSSADSGVSAAPEEEP
jgi:hypothetical protein